MDRLDDCRKTLGISADADSEEIRRDYHDLVKRHHTDLAKGLDSEARFHQMQEAYDYLGMGASEAP